MPDTTNGGTLSTWPRRISSRQYPQIPERHPDDIGAARLHSLRASFALHRLGPPKVSAKQPDRNWCWTGAAI